MKEIPLTQGKVALVDDEDYERLKQHKWYARKDYRTYYAMRHTRGTSGKQTTLLMHQEIMCFHEGEANGREIDHRNRNGLDNQKHNIWYCTRRQNAENRSDNTSGYPGVYWFKITQKWKAQATINGKKTHLGYFATPQEAYEHRHKVLDSQDIA